MSHLVRLNSDDISSYTGESAANTALDVDVVAASANYRYTIYGFLVSPSAAITTHVPVSIKDGTTVIYKGYLTAAKPELTEDFVPGVPITKGNALHITIGAAGGTTTVSANVQYATNIV